ncbi:MAG: recombinase zinc ribbon domain-containing protein [Nitrospiria bacterium]
MDKPLTRHSLPATIQGTRRSLGSTYLLTGKLRCTRCGHKLVGMSATGNGGTYRYYTCLSRTKYGPGACPQDRLDADDLERDLLAHLMRYLKDSTFLTEAVDKMLTDWKTRLQRNCRAS